MEKNIFFIVVLQAFFGTIAPLNKKLLLFATPLFLTTIRMLTSGVLSVATQYWHNRSLFVVQKRHLIYFFVITFGMYIRYMLKYWGLFHLATTKMALMLNCTPFFIALLSYYAFNKKITLKQWFALCLGFASMSLIMLTQSDTETLLRSFLVVSWPELAMLGAITMHSINIISMQKLIKESHYSSDTVYGISTFGGGLLGLLTILVSQQHVYVTDVTSFVSFFTVLALVSTISNIAYYNMLNYHTATFMSLTDCLGPLFVALYSYFLLGETLSWHYYASALMVSYALFLFYQDEK